jgi:hypothetical protein
VTQLHVAQQAPADQEGCSTIMKWSLVSEILTYFLQTLAIFLVMILLQQKITII